MSVSGSGHNITPVQYYNQVSPRWRPKGAETKGISTGVTTKTWIFWRGGGVEEEERREDVEFL